MTKISYIRRRRPRNVDAPRESLAELFRLDGATFERNGVDARVLYQLRALVDTEGVEKVAKDMQLTAVTVLRVLAGFAHRLRPGTVKKVVEYFRPGR